MYMSIFASISLSLSIPISICMLEHDLIPRSITTPGLDLAGRMQDRYWQGVGGLGTCRRPVISRQEDGDCLEVS